MFSAASPASLTKSSTCQEPSHKHPIGNVYLCAELELQPLLLQGTLKGTPNLPILRAKKLRCAWKMLMKINVLHSCAVPWSAQCGPSTQ
jgi:hypothetical protein